MELSTLVVDILKLGITGFGFLLLYMLYKAVTGVTDAIIKSPKALSPETQRTVLRSMLILGVLSAMFFMIAAVLNIWTILRPHQLDLIIHPSGLERSQLPIFMRGAKRINLSQDQALSFVIDERENLNADITPVIDLLKRQVAINAEQQRIIRPNGMQKEAGYDEPR